MKIMMTSLAVLALGLSGPVFAQDYNSGTSYDTQSEAVSSSPFIKKRYSINGTWSLAEKDGVKVISFNDDFKTKGGPDLKLFLSSKPLDELGSGDVLDSSLKLSVLKSNKGAQSYIIPADVDLSQYKSVVIHCEAFSVLWGGFDL